MMKTKVSIKTGHALQQKTACLVLPVYAGKARFTHFSALDEALNGQLGKSYRQREFGGYRDEMLLLHGGPGLSYERLLLVGMGPRKTVTAAGVRHLASQLTAYLVERRIGGCLIDSSELMTQSRDANLVVQALTEGILLAGYRFDRYLKKDDDSKPPLEAAGLLIPSAVEKNSIKQSVSTAEALVAGICRARNLVNQPGNDKSPAYLAETAQQIAADYGLDCTLLGRDELEKEGFGALLAVAQGSERQPFLITLEYRGGGQKEAPVALIGKGVVFDTGGLSLKPSEKMDEMKMDMAGGAAVLGTIQTVAALKLPVNLLAVVPAVENLPSGKAYRPGDIVTSLAGKTIEVLNTDAEGRLILADALTWVQRYNPRVVIDVATLTGACIIALGHHASAVLGNHEGLIRALLKAGERCGDRLWQLPLWNEYSAQIKGDFAEIKNTGGRPAGAITAAAFLQHFAEKYTWAHLDIAGTAWAEKNTPGTPKGGTGVGVRLLFEYLRGQC